MKLLKSFGFALAGIAGALREQTNLRLHFLAFSVVIAAGFYVHISRMEWCVLLLASGLVIGLELINTAIENLTDLVTMEKHPLAGKVKDVAAGAVLAASFIAFVIGVIIFAPYID